MGKPNHSAAEHPPGQGRRVFPGLTLVVAALGMWGAHVAGDRAREYNSSRAVGGLIVAGMMSAPEGTASGPAVSSRTGLPLFRLPPPAGAGLVPSLPLKDLTRATARAEVIILTWERLTYGVAGLVAAAGLAGLFTRWTRASQLSAAAVIVVSTAATLLAMRLLVDPAQGAFHPLPAISYLLAAAIQSSHGLLLLAVFARQRPLAR